MNIFSLNWWISTLVSTFITMIFIWIIKQAGAKFKIPVVSTIVEQV